MLQGRGLGGKGSKVHATARHRRLPPSSTEALAQVQFQLCAPSPSQLLASQPLFPHPALYHFQSCSKVFLPLSLLQ